MNRADRQTLISPLEGMLSPTWHKPSDLKIQRMLAHARNGEAASPTVAFYRCAHPGCDGRIEVVHTHGEDPQVDLSQLPLDEVARVTTARASLALGAVEAAAVALHWARMEVDGKRGHYCTRHARDTACARCHFQDCSCVGGPRLDRVFVTAENLD